MTEDAIDVDSIPAELRSLNQWVTWRFEERGAGETTKVPYSANGRLARSNDPATWGAFEDVLRAARQREADAGVGFVFAESGGIFGIDLDKVIDHRGELEKMGIFNSPGRFAWNNKDGTVNYFGELAQIGKWASDQITKGVARGDIAQQMFGAFGKQGGTIASLFADPQMTGILAGIERYLKDPNVGLGAASRNRQLGLGYQFTRATSNLVSVMTELGYPWLQDLTNFFRGVGDNLHNFQAWLHQHRDAEKTIGAAFAGIATALGGFAVFGAAKLAGAGTLLKSITDGLGGLEFAIRVLAPWALRLVPIVGWIAGAVTAIQLINNLPNIAANIARWWQINQNKISYTIGYVFGTMGHWLAAAIQGLLGMAQAAIAAVMNQIRNPSEFAKLLLPGGQAVVAHDIYQAVMKAQRDYQVTGADLPGQFRRGLTGGLGGHSYQPAAALHGKYGPDAGKGVNVHIETIQLKVDGDPKSSGAALASFLASIQTHPMVTLRRAGNLRRVRSSHLARQSEESPFQDRAYGGISSRMCSSAFATKASNAAITAPIPKPKNAMNPSHHRASRWSIVRNERTA